MNSFFLTPLQRCSPNIYLRGVTYSLVTSKIYFKNLYVLMLINPMCKHIPLIFFTAEDKDVCINYTSTIFIYIYPLTMWCKYWIFHEQIPFCLSGWCLQASLKTDIVLSHRWLFISLPSLHVIDSRLMTPLSGSSEVTPSQTTTARWWQHRGATCFPGRIRNMATQQSSAPSAKWTWKRVTSSYTKFKTNF